MWFLTQAQEWLLPTFFASLAAVALQADPLHLQAMVVPSAQGNTFEPASFVCEDCVPVMQSLLWTEYPDRLSHEGNK